VAGSLQELDESQLWLELLEEECRIAPLTTTAFQQEATELIAIMSAMISRTKAKMKTPEK